MYLCIYIYIYIYTVEGKRKVTEFCLVPELLQSSIRLQPEYWQKSHRQMENSNRDLSEFLQKLPAECCQITARPQAEFSQILTEFYK